MSESARTPAQIESFQRVLERQRARRKARRTDNHEHIGRHEYAEIRAMLDDAAAGDRSWA